MNGLQSIAQWKEYFGNPSGSVLGIVNAAQSIGSVVSLPVVGILSDYMGRRLTLLSGAIVVVIASIIQAALVQYGMFVFSRVLVGVGSMLVVQPSPMLITELAYPTHRGKYTSAFWTMYYLGAILASWASYGTQKHLNTSEWSWRGSVNYPSWASHCPDIALVVGWSLSRHGESHLCHCQYNIH
jgi:MFS family permease